MPRGSLHRSRGDCHRRTRDVVVVDSMWRGSTSYKWTKANREKGKCSLMNIFMANFLAVRASVPGSFPWPRAAWVRRGARVSTAPMMSNGRLARDDKARQPRPPPFPSRPNTISSYIWSREGAFDHRIDDLIEEPSYSRIFWLEGSPSHLRVRANSSVRPTSPPYASSTFFYSSFTREGTD